MKINLSILLVISIVLVSYSCKQSNDKISKSMNDSVLIIYFCGNVEFNISQTFESMSKNVALKSYPSEKLHVSHREFAMLKKIVHEFKELKGGEKLESCDSRMYIKMGSIEFCIGDNNCVCNAKENISIKNLKSIYFIKSLSGYYDFFSKDDLLNDQGVIKFGLPKDYLRHFRPTNKFPKEEFKKLVICE
jgi:hypothetical protein